MKIDWNFQGRSQEHLKRPKNGDGGGSRLKISKGAVWHPLQFFWNNTSDINFTENNFFQRLIA